MDTPRPPQLHGVPPNVHELQQALAERERDLQQTIEARENELAWANERLIAELHERAAAQASAMAAERYDPISGLPNRRLFEEQLERAALEHKNGGEPAALLIVGIDQLVEMRASWGFGAADQAARLVGERLRLAVRGCDLVGRIGDGEFGIVLTHLRASVDAACVARKLINLIEAPLRIDGNDVSVKAAVGVAVLPNDAADAAELMQRAFSALRGAHATAERVYRLFDPSMAQRDARRLQLHADMRKALEEAQFLLHYQPRVSMNTRAVVGVEALLRWMHPRFGLLPAGQFIEVADENGLIVPIGEMVLTSACAAAAEWPVPIAVSVNLSARQMRSSDLDVVIRRILAQAGLPPQRLQVEVNEASLGRQPDEIAANIQRLQALRRLGVGIALDQFGTGACSLTLLRDCAVDALNIEGGFIRSLTEDAAATAIVQAIAGLGRHFGTEVVAEGVESEEQLERAALAGCTQAQGYLFGRPMPLEDFRQFLAQDAG